MPSGSGTSTAVMAASWNRAKWKHSGGSGFPGLMGPMNPAGNVYSGDANAGPIGLTVEIYLGDGWWENITPYVYYRDRVRISRGRRDETSRIQPQTCQLTINNRDGRFSPRNATGPYYGKIGRNTLLRVSRYQNGVQRFRFYGEVISWPTTWDISGTDVYAQITAAGQLRRLQQGSQNLGSTMFRGYTFGESITLHPLAYWPCEDGATSTTLASGLQGAPDMTFNGSPNLASNSQFLCSLPLPVLNGSTWYGTVPAYTGGTANILRFLMAVPSTTSITDGTVIAQMHTLGTVKRADLKWRTGGGLELAGYDASGTQLFTTGPVVFAVDGQLMRVSVELKTNGSSVDYSIGTILANGTNIAVVFGSTLPSASIGPCTLVVVNPSAAITDTVIGHISVQNTVDPLQDLGFQLNAWSGENPVSRIIRLAGEQQINLVDNSLGFIGNTVTMGYQLSDTFANTVQQVVDTDLGLLYEAADQLALVYRTRLSLYNQGTSYNNARRGLTLDYAQNQLSGPLDPTDDDAYTRNDVTVQRISGSSAQATQTTGSLNTQDPPAGVGDYANTYSISLGGDYQLPDQAGWRLHMGTVDEPRYPHLQLNLRNAQFTGNVDLLNQALTLDIGDLVIVNNPPPWMPPDQIRQILQGYTETLGIFEHDMVLNCSPESPYRVAMLDDPILGRLDTDGSTLAADLGAPLNTDGTFATGVSTWTATSCSVAQVGTSGSANPLPSGGPTGYGALITANGGSSVQISQNLASFPVVAGQTYNISALVYYPSAAHTVMLGIAWRDVNNAFLGSGSSFVAVPANTWTAISLPFTAPANAVLANPLVGLGGTPANGDTLYTTGVVIWQGAVSVATTNPNSPLWTTGAGDFPFDVSVGGERMTVTSISGAASPQAFTVARAVNGVVKAQAAGTDVRLYQPTILSL